MIAYTSRPIVPCACCGAPVRQYLTPRQLERRGARARCDYCRRACLPRSGAKNPHRPPGVAS